MHRREIDELLGKTRAQPLTLIPLRVYFNDGKVKVELGLAKGKKLYDKRQELAKRDAERDMARVPREGPSAAGRLATSGAAVAAAERGPLVRWNRGDAPQEHGGEWSRRWPSRWEKRAVVSGAT